MDAFLVLASAARETPFNAVRVGTSGRWQPYVLYLGTQVHILVEVSDWDSDRDVVYLIFLCEFHREDHDKVSYELHVTNAD